MRSDGFYLRNDLRRRSLCEVYNPLTGEGCCGERVVVKRWRKRFRIPAAMCADAEYAGLKVDSPEWRRLRCRYDFEYWCATCAYIKPKSGGRPVLCVLNEGQRSVVEALESDRMACRPSRAVVLKARQWGCSTVIQLYIAWLQTCVYQGANAVICAHLKNTAAMIRGMYSRLLSRYPDEMVCGSEKPKLRNFEGSTEIKTISGRECTVMIGSCINPDAIRGSDISLAHLTEVAYWRNTASVSPEDVAQAVYGTVSFEKGTLVVLESTASGVGNFFHREWLGAKASCCAHAVFVPWNELSVNSREVEDARSVFETMDEEERALFDGGMCIEQVYWRRCKRQEMVNAERFNAEFPLHDTDAFASNDMNVFDALHVEELRRGCSVPAERGGIYGLNFVPAPNGRLSVWRRPEAGRTYVRLSMSAADLRRPTGRSWLSCVRVRGMNFRRLWLSGADMWTMIYLRGRLWRLPAITMRRCLSWKAIRWKARGTAAERMSLRRCPAAIRICMCAVRWGLSTAGGRRSTASTRTGRRNQC